MYLSHSSYFIVTVSKQIILVVLHERKKQKERTGVQQCQMPIGDQVT